MIKLIKLNTCFNVMIHKDTTPIHCKTNIHNFIYHDQNFSLFIVIFLLKK